MKHIVTSIIGIVFMISAISAQAVYVPGWDCPIEKASLQEFDTTGHEMGIGLDKSLTLHKMDGSEKATSFTFAEEMKIFCVVAPCNPIPQIAKFRIVRITNDRCGSTVYTAVEIVKPGRDSESDPFLRQLEVVDHGSRLCEDYKPFQWEVKLSPVGNNTNVRFFRGNPEPIYTIQ